jgi:protein SCO1/2
MKQVVRLVTVLIVALFVTACGHNEQKWQTQSIAGVMPDLQFTLTDENGNVVHADDYRGKIKLMYFGYTHCPDICPMTLATVGRALKQLGNEAGRVRVLFVSVDPKRDPPQQLKQYTHAFGPQFIGLTGTQDQLHALSKRYRIAYGYEKPDANGDYVVNHSSAIFVFDDNGNAKLLMGRTDGAKAMAHDLRQLIHG